MPVVRKRTGCLNCRKRHKKCDEAKPSCSLCAKKKEQCQWPLLNGRFHKNSHSELFSKVNSAPALTATTNLEDYSERLMDSFKKINENLSVSHLSNSVQGPTSSLDSKSRDGDEQPQADIFPGPAWNGQIHGGVAGPFVEQNPGQPFDQNVPANVSHHSGSLHLSKRSYDGHSGSPDRHSVGSIFKSLLGEGDPSAASADPFAPFILYSDLHSTLRDYMFTNAAVSEMEYDFPPAQDMVFSPTPGPTDGENHQKSLYDLELRLKHLHNAHNSRPTNGSECTPQQRLRLYHNYIYEISPWLDMFDITRTFGIKIPQLADNNDALRNSLLAISSRQIELTDPKYDRNITLGLYQESLRGLIPTVNKSIDESMISSCVILCVLEMMSSSPGQWRHHLEGCAALFKAKSINGFSDSLNRGLFWCYARMEICAALIAETNTIIESKLWLPKDCGLTESRKLFLEHNSADMYSNYMVFLCSLVLNLIYTDNPNYKQEWEWLWNEVIEWHANRPRELRPFASFEETPFPGILFLAGPAVSANQLYHMAIILLTENKPRLFKLAASEHVKSIIWHAKQICAISLHNTHHGCWNNALQPLWIAGKHLSSEEEHKIILDLLNRIEKATGWQMNFRARDLIDYWNGQKLG